MKRRICIFTISILMSASILTGCGNGGNSSKDTFSLDEIKEADILDRRLEHLTRLSKEAVLSIDGVSDVDISVTEETDETDHIYVIVTVEENVEKDTIYNDVCNCLGKILGSAEVTVDIN